MNNFEDWTRALGELFEETLEGTEQAIQATVEVADTLADQLERHLIIALDQMMEELQQTVTPVEETLEAEVERWVVEIADVMIPLVTPVMTDLEQWLASISQPLASTVDPLVNHHQPCIGCRFYHGQTYGDVMLVCGMHPYGPTADSCQDWQAVWEAESVATNG